jgi:hypothetical protein
VFSVALPVMVWPAHEHTPGGQDHSHHHG